MTSPQFIHLRLHSEYSIVDGLVRIDDAVKAAANDAQPALAITDLANLFGMVKFYKAARGKGIKPIAGCDVWITNEDDRDKPSRLLLLVKNKTGYLQLCDLLSRAWLTNLYRGRAEIRAEWLEARTPGGLIVLSGAHFGDIGMRLRARQCAGGRALRAALGSRLPRSFLYRVQRAGQPNMEQQVRQSVALAAKLQLPVVATHPVQFLSSGRIRRA
jgi:DNA polymerase-3 subunit alpha